MEANKKLSFQPQVQRPQNMQNMPTTMNNYYEQVKKCKLYGLVRPRQQLNPEQQSQTTGLEPRTLLTEHTQSN